MWPRSIEHRCAAVLLGHVNVRPAQVRCPFSHPALHVIAGAPWVWDVEHLQVASGDDAVLAEGACQPLPCRLAEAVVLRQIREVFLVELGELVWWRVRGCPHDHRGAAAARR